ncbi:MAG TPA: ABC transporter permease, partial [Longimicrobiales bacterium]|nr:ABC transporter permease [Longimicrobiales bacterium]
MNGDARGPRRRLRLFRPGGRRTVDRELAHHLAERVDRLVAEGWDPDDAKREAEARFGDVEGIRKELMAMETTDRGRRTMMRWVDEVVQDVRYGVRALRRRPGFAVALILTLGLGIGANTAIFTVADALLLRPLPYRDVDRLVEVSLKLNGTTTVPFLFADQVEPWLDGADFLEASAYHESVTLVRTDAPEPEGVHVLAVTPELDDLLGAPFRMGRGLAPDDARPGAPGVAILTYGYWFRHGSDPDVLGQELRLDGAPYTVVGVLDRRFKFPVAGTYDLWVPVADDMTAAGRPLGRAEVVGRLRPGATLQAARERADGLAASLEEAAPHRYGWEVALTPVGRWRANPQLKQAVEMLAGGVGLLLIIALVNGVNLLLTRGTTRLPEMGIRTAIGASRGRLGRQVLVEGVVVATVAGTVATALAWGGLAAVRSTLPDELRFSSVYDFTVEGRTLTFTFVLTFATGLLLGLLPALQAARGGALAAVAPRGG